MSNGFRKITLSIVLIGFVSILFSLVFISSERYFLKNLMEENAAAHRLTWSGLQGALLRYEPVAPLVADKDDVITFLKEGNQSSFF